VKTTILVGQYALNKCRATPMPSARVSPRTLRAAYDAVLGDHDLLLMPALPLKATPITAPAAPRMQIIQREGPRL
jgi:amidase